MQNGAAAAIDNGADAVYLGYRAYSARAGAENFDGEALEEILKKAHFAGVKVYVAMNTLVKESETEEFVKTLLEVWNSGADAIIMQDVLLGRFVHERYSDIVLHLSTQAGVCNTEGARFRQKMRLFEGDFGSGNAACGNRKNRGPYGDRSICAGRPLHLLFGTVLFFFLRGRKQRQPRKMQTALP